MNTRSTIAVLVALSGGCLFGLAQSALAQYAVPPAASLPDPFEAPQYNWAKTVDGGPWSSSAGIEIGPHNEVWAINRCDANSCENSSIAPIVELDMTTGQPIKAIGANLFVWPHGLAIDRKGNIWVTDAQSSKDGMRGEQVIKLSPDGKVLMRLGTGGVAGGGPDHFNAPTDVAIAPNGDIFVADGHDGSVRNSPVNYVTRIVKFSPAGKFIKQWGKLGSGPGEFQVPHALAFDRQGRLFVADRDNERIQIFDQNGKFIAAWKQFGRLSGLWIDKNDTLYTTDTSGGGWKQPGILIGSAKTGVVTAFVPDLDAGEGVVIDPAGNLYAAVNVAPHGITKYPKPDASQNH